MTGGYHSFYYASARKLPAGNFGGIGPQPPAYVELYVIQEGGTDG
jgi:hypothetical protein